MVGASSLHDRRESFRAGRPSSVSSLLSHLFCDLPAYGVELAITSTAVLAMAFVAFLCWMYFRLVAQESSIPDGDLVYQDTKRIGVFEPLVSHTHRLTGQPDYLIRTKEGLVPLEVKSRAYGSRGPYSGEVAQVAAYCRLVEDVFGEPVSQGVLQFVDREVKVLFSQDRRTRILELLSEMRSLEDEDNVSRNHNQARRCQACGYRAHGICGQAIK